MTPLRQHMIAALQLSGTGERTPQSSVREVRLLSQFYGKSPDLISEPELQASFLHSTNVDGLAPASRRICSSGITFFSQHVLRRDWHTLSLIRAQTAPRLPAVLRTQEVRRRLQAATPLHHQVTLPTVYSLGLRLHEARSLQGADIDSQRLLVHVHRGKGAQDRYVPLPEETLVLLRTSWTTHRNPTWLLPATGRDQKQRPPAAFPMRRARVQGAFRKAKQRAGIVTAGVAIHALRHASATPLRDTGGTIRQAGRLEHIDPPGWSIPWHVHAPARPDGHAAFKSLAPAVLRVALSNRRLVALKDRTVTLPSHQPGSARQRTTRLEGIECIRRVLPHVLPEGFQKVRHVGFPCAGCIVQCATLRRMVSAT